MSTPAVGDTVVTVKVNHNGRMCRFKLPLRDMSANTLEDKLRACLEIDPATECVFERYSDSASAFVVLDRTNLSVYKQLYRAAKAKQRLKIKVTTPTKDEPAPESEQQQEVIKEEGKEEAKEEPTVSVQVPKPATVEDEPEPSAAAPSEMTEISKMEPMSSAKLVAGCGFASSKTTPFGGPSLDYIRFPALSPTSGPFDDFSFAPKKPTEPAQEPEEPTPPARPAKEPIVQSTIAPEPLPSISERPGFAVCCNSCDVTIPDVHYHCQTCDDGDFDLCQSCVDAGITCYVQDHWLIKRFVRGGKIINSTTEKISPKPKPKPQPAPEQPKQPEATNSPATSTDTVPPAPRLAPTTCSNTFARVVPIMQEPHRFALTRTCNCCVQEFPENQFVHCKDCDDFDLCKQCFVKDAHGHHPGHSFEPAVPGGRVEPVVKIRLGPGRNERHSAICDGCDRPICGVRHKCLDCPDWDYCSECVINAEFVHEGHRFVPIYGSIKPSVSKTVHFGICCDGPLCNPRRSQRYVKGTRYKCAVCHDTDFCANCEASPANTHNKTHPLIKFKTPVRNVTVTTTGDKRTGEPLPTMGDRIRNSTSSRATSTHTAVANGNSSTPIQTLVSVKPAEPAPEPEPVESPKEAPKESAAPAPVPIPKLEDLQAVYVRDTVLDGTDMPPNHVFEQTWTLRNDGKVAWPAGCSVKFVGGDYMGHPDPSHPAGVIELVSAHESTVCYQPLEPGREFSFTVLLRTPSSPGKVVSYWRLSTPEGYRFGHRLWCDVSVVKNEEPKEELKAETKDSSPAESQMIFPKLEKESPVSSMHEEAKPQPEEQEEVEEFEELAEDDEDWVAESESVLTDDEYDLIDASDEEYCEMMEKNGK